MVGVRGFEPPTPSSRTRCATRLRYTPMCPPKRPRAPYRHARRFAQGRATSQEQNTGGEGLSFGFPFAVENRHRGGRVTFSLFRSPRDRRLDRRQIGLAEGERSGGRGFVPLHAFSRPDERHDVVLSRQNPGDGDRGDACRPRRGDGAQRVDEFQIVVKVLADEARSGFARIRARSPAPCSSAPRSGRARARRKR